jgi:N-hydroxyarylamine O-acetyltransferase
VADAAGEFGPEFDHMALLVTLRERHLVDVGFGDSFRKPLLLGERAEQSEGASAYRIDEAGDRYTLLRRDGNGAWRAQYRFGLQPHVYADYAGMCRHHQTSPQSHFTRHRVCSLATPGGRVTLSGLRLITTMGGEREERELAGEEEFAAALRERFGIEPPREAVKPGLRP